MHALICLAALSPPTAVAAAPADPPMALPAAAWILVDADSGEVLTAHAARVQRPIASTTKLMTALLAMRNLDPADRVTAVPYSAVPGESLLGLRAGEEISVHDLLNGLLLASGNDAAVSLAVASAGSVDAFVARMNREAQALGMDDTSYANPVGLDDPAAHSTAADLATLTRALRELPLFRRIVDTTAVRLTEGATPRQITNRNELLQVAPWISGVKTGYTLGAGNVLVASADDDPVHLISVVMGAPTEPDRDEASLELLRWGRSLYEPRLVIEKGQHLGLATVTGAGGVPLIAARDLELVLRQGQEVEIGADGPSRPLSEVTAGDRLGKAVVSSRGEDLGSVPLVAAASATAPEPASGPDLDGLRDILEELAWPWLVAGVALILILGIIRSTTGGR